ncbi:hypothetical protein [Dinoroseobacter sp. S76]|uniref:hypothetical protein n=1 Tax=Dinoroseobacter sp. S76 TaxID=3415124 RepID=UPI003C7A4271
MIVEFTAKHCLEAIAKPQVEAFSKEPDNVTFFFGSFLCLDAFFGVHWAESGRNVESDYSTDLAYRESFAEKHPIFRIFRDTATSMKHGKLVRPSRKQRVVTSVESLSTATNILSANGVLGAESVIADREIYIYYDHNALTSFGSLVDSCDWVSASFCARKVLSIAQSALTGGNIAPAPLNTCRGLFGPQVKT